LFCAKQTVNFFDSCRQCLKKSLIPSLLFAIGTYDENRVGRTKGISQRAKTL
jgi:hypothetical protein